MRPVQNFNVLGNKGNHHISDKNDYCENDCIKMICLNL